MDEPAGDAVERFVVHVDDDVLDDLRERLARTRLPDQIPGTGWEYGTPVDVLAPLVEYWRDAYDWRAQEAELNLLDHCRTVIDGQPFHFVHARSPHEDALPLLLVHGWPGSIIEFLDVIPRLTHPEEHGGAPADAFHVVAPSLPGYAFSPPPTEPGWDIVRTARAFVTLMERLWYPRYGAQGGDWGAQITTRMAGMDAEHMIGLHLNLALATPPADAGPLTDEEQADLAVMRRFQASEGAYAALQMTKPQTLAAALDDSPAGLLSWILEKFRTWSDCDGDPFTTFDRDRLLTNVMLYWVTRTFASSARMYWETAHSGALAQPLGSVTVPTGVARYPKEEILRFPRSWVERTYHVTHWAVMPRGGHFAAMEQPDLFVDDVRTFFRTVR
jgi:pimeloyl-ACP methyl ester carboxylesterase